MTLPADLVITSFPDRWDCTYERDSLLDVMRKRIEYLDVDHKVQPNRLVIEIMNACAGFQPTAGLEGLSFTWTDAFDDEILSVVSQVIWLQSYNQDRTWFVD